MAVTSPRTSRRTSAELNATSDALLDQIKDVTEKIRGEEKAKLANLQAQEANEANRRVSRMWVMRRGGQLRHDPHPACARKLDRRPDPEPDRRGAAVAERRLNRARPAALRATSFRAWARRSTRWPTALCAPSGNCGKRTSGSPSSRRRCATPTRASSERVDLKTKELEDKNRALNEAARLKDEFLATLSHELRTPLTPIISCTHLLGSAPKLPPEEMKSVQVIDRNARALSRMIDELLDLSIVTNRKLRLVRERTEMNDWTHTTMEMVRPDWEKKGLEVSSSPT